MQLLPVSALLCVPHTHATAFALCVCKRCSKVARAPPNCRLLPRCKYQFSKAGRSSRQNYIFSQSRSNRIKRSNNHPITFPQMNQAIDATKEEIMQRRLAYNRVLSNRDADGFQRYLCDDFIQQSSNLNVVRGLDDVRRSYVEDEFVDPSFIEYNRIPLEVQLSENGCRAVERGRWKARFRKSSPATGSAATMVEGKEEEETGGSGLYQAGWYALVIWLN